MLTPRRVTPASGFSLIELAVVMAIVGLMLTAFLRFYDIMDQKQRIETTRTRLQDVRTALIFYVLTHNRLPCPASALKGADDKDACAPDARSPPDGVSAHAVVIEGHTDTDTSADIWEGVVPVRDLSIDPQLGIDGWGNRFSYAVSRNLTLPEGMHANPLPTGHISVIDENGNNLLELPGTGRFVIISHGPSGSGAWTREGKRRPCQQGTQASQNCENNGAYVIAPFSMAPGRHYFDNFVVSDDENAGGTLIDRIAICTRKLKFFEPGTPTADRDGCVDAQEDNGAWHGMCLKTGDPNSKAPVMPILRPAIADGTTCGCLQGLGLVPMLAGSWLQAPEIPGSPPGTGMMSLYTCVRQ